MKCNNFSILCLRDKHTYLDIVRLFFHRIHCSECRILFKNYNSSLHILKNTSPFLTDLTVSSVMTNIYLVSGVDNKNRSHPHLRWLTAGTLLLGGALFISQSRYYSSIISVSHQLFPIILFMILGICIIIFSLIYVGSHIEELRKLFKV
ncbi:MAG: hypothetical protein PF637_13730 [Spirochaetes bacterium]|jgi:hypothetical protein|nr:hypothetical protein [Spirochaetota bacterium]